MSNKVFGVLLSIVASTALIVLIALVASVLAPNQTSFTYTAFEGNMAVCLGDPLSGMVYGHTEGKANITQVVETIYQGDGSQIAKRFPTQPPITGDPLEPTDFSFPLVVDLDGLHVGGYRYVRTSIQQLGDGKPSQLAQLSVRFSVVDCGE